MSSREVSVNAVLQVREEPYAIVNGCDSFGHFALFCVYPNNNKRGDSTMYVIIARILEGVYDGCIKPRVNNFADCWESAIAFGNYAIRITLAEALVLFLDPLVARTKELSPGAIPVIRWWQQHRRPGPQRHEDLVMPLLGKRELARIADESMRDSTEAEREELEEHQSKFAKHFLASEIFKKSHLNASEREEMGVSAKSSALEIMERWLKCPKLLQRYIQIAAHMRLLYKLGGEYPDLADLWSTEVKIQTDLGRFIDSGLAKCVNVNTRRILQWNSSNSWIEASCRFFQTPEIEETGLTVLRGMGAWSCFLTHRRSLDEDPVVKDLVNETVWLLREGVMHIFQHLQERLPKFESAFKNTFEDCLTELLLRSFMGWYAMYVHGREGPLASAGKDPPSDFVTNILHKITEEKSLEDHVQAVSETLSRAFWNVACMAVHPKLFDYPTETGGRGVRKTTSTTIAPSRLAWSEEAFTLLVAAFCSLDHWLDRFSEAQLPTLKKCLTVTVHPPEIASVQRILCPRHFSLDVEAMVPSDELLQRATNRDNPYLTSLFKLMAVQLPYTTLKLLEGVKLLREQIDKTNKKAFTKLEENRSTSTTKKQKGQCAGCGTKEETVKKMLKCSRCLIVRYCSVGCQKKHWPVHKKVCSPVNK
jgi:hypothetical protein